MADDKRKSLTQAYREAAPRTVEIESLAAAIFARRVATATGRTHESMAADALAAAKLFYRTCDDRPGDTTLPGAT